MTMFEPGAPAREPMSKTAKIWLSVIAIGGVIAIGDAAHGGGQTAPGIDYSTRVLVKAGCHEAVGNLLTSPATANWHDNPITANPDGSYNDMGTVDSENGFGAVLTTAFNCQATSDGTVLGQPEIFGS